jgi:hypothetical protein
MSNILYIWKDIIKNVAVWDIVITDFNKLKSS